MKMRISLLMGFVVLMILPKWSIAQAYRKVANPDSYNGNFVDMAKQIDMFYDTATGTNLSGYKQWKREEWFAMHHLDEKGKLGNYIEKNIEAADAMKKMSANNSRMPSTGDWLNSGHASITGDEAKQGRVNSVAFDPVNSAIVYVASAGGGIWKTFNNGDTWTNLTVDLPILGISDIIVAPAPNNQIVYALTGDAVLCNFYFHNSIGVIKSYNGGLTWVRTNLAPAIYQQRNGSKLIMSPTNENVLLASMSDGIHRTIDGGHSWTQIITGSVNDMEYRPNDPNTLYFTSPGVDNLFILNLTTLAITSTLINTTTPSDRMEIAVTPDNNSAVYLLAGPGYVTGTNNWFNGLFYSGNNGGSFTLRTNFCTNNGDLFNSAQSLSWYANTILVDPNEENNVIVGGMNLFNSTNGGVSLTQVTSNSIHSDQHNLKRNPLNGDLWLCNDGGVYRSTDNGNTWNTRSNGLIINEYYRISGTNNATDLLLGGTQDNGHFLSYGPGDFHFVMGGDGMDNYFNSYDNSIAYACKQNGAVCRSVNSGQGFGNSIIPNGGNGSFFPWITPIVQHPPHYVGFPIFWENTDVIYAYSLNGIIRSVDGFTWPNIGPPGIGQVPNSKCPSMAICADANGTTNLYISNGNSFWACFNPMDEVPDWNLFALPINNTTYVSAIAVNPAIRSEVWVTISGYVAGTKVFRSQNAGLTWSNVSHTLPNTPVYSIVFANNTNNPSGAVYIGTEIGVFYKDDGLADWVPFSNRLPHVPVTDLEINYFTSELKAATYGRGIWRTALYEYCPPLVNVDFEINQGQFNFESSNLINAYHTITGGIGTRVTLKAANQVKLLNGFRVNQDSYLRIAIGNCGTGPIGLAVDQADPSIGTSVGKDNKTQVEGN